MKTIPGIIKIEKQVKIILVFFMAALIVSGLTAIPLKMELEFLTSKIPNEGLVGEWLYKVYAALQNVYDEAPFLAYGMDWLAFAHVVIAITFIGPLMNPVKNIWVIQFGMIACLSVIPLAMIAGYFRDIPMFWRLIDCSFGIIGMIPLLICYRKVRKIESLMQRV